jgi:hypothetical protein
MLARLVVGVWKGNVNVCCMFQDDGFSGLLSVWCCPIMQVWRCFCLLLMMTCSADTRECDAASAEGREQVGGWKFFAAVDRMECAGLECLECVGRAFEWALLCRQRHSRARACRACFVPHF